MKTLQIEISKIEMVRKSGYGQYAINVSFSVNGEEFDRSFRTTDSQLWDEDCKTDEMLLNHIGGEERILDTI